MSKKKKLKDKRSVNSKDPYHEAEKAEQIARKRLIDTPGYEDLAAFYVSIYTDEELIEMGEEPGKWAGQYVKGSVNSNETPPTVLLNISHHPTAKDMADTITHEMGHALWELLDENSQKLWFKKATSDMRRWGPEEAFADNLMYFVKGDKSAMHNRKLWEQITQKKK